MMTTKAAISQPYTQAPLRVPGCACDDLSRTPQSVCYQPQSPPWLLRRG